MAASHFGLDNFILIIDRNELQLADRTERIMALDPLPDKLRSFGFDVRETNGNDPDGLAGLSSRSNRAKAVPSP
jgi:transketolase